MSKKTRKKSPKKASKTTLGKTASGKAARARSVTSAKTAATKTRKAPASKPGKTAKKQLGKAAPKATSRAPQKPPSKPLKPALSKPAPAKPEAAKPAPKAVEEKAHAASTAKAVVAEGAEAPAFRLPRDGGDTVSLSDYAGKKLVLFFYPRADTPGCTREAIDFTRLASAFAQHGTAVLGVSADPLKAQEAFRNKHQLTTPLVSDEQHEMLQAYGAWG